MEVMISAAFTFILVMDPLGNVPLFLASLKNTAPERRQFQLAQFAVGHDEEVAAAASWIEELQRGQLVEERVEVPFRPRGLQLRLQVVEEE